MPAREKFVFGMKQKSINIKIDSSQKFSMNPLISSGKVVSVFRSGPLFL